MGERARASRIERGEPDRGAERPRDIPRRGWLGIAKSVWREQGEDQVSLLAAGVAFYAMLALVPGLIAAVTIYGLALEPADVQRQIESLAGVLPQSSREILHDQLTSIVGDSGGGLTIALVLSLAGALWGASSGVQTLMQAVNTAFDEDETRSAIGLRLRALAGTVGAILAFLIVVALVAVLPAVLNSLGLGETGKTLVSIARWPVLAALAIVGLALVYRYAPDRPPVRWRWVTWGAAIATALWLVASWGFSFYVANFGSYNETYGSLGAVVVLLLWLWISAFVVLLGAEIDAAIERRAGRRPRTPGLAARPV